MDTFGIFYSLASLVVLVLVVSYMISTSGNLREIREEAEAQRRLLAQIEKNTRPPAPAADTMASSPTRNYMKEGKESSVGIVVAVLGALFAILLIVALANK